jgi:hypothetical protein
MRKIIYLLSFFVLFSSCIDTKDNLCEYEGYIVHSVSEESSCECGRYELHLVNGHVFKDIYVTNSAYAYYQSLLKKSKGQPVVIECSEKIELKNQAPPPSPPDEKPSEVEESPEE